MANRLATLLAVTVLLAPGCASAPPHRGDRDRTIRRALEPCERQYPTVRVLGIDDQGRLQAQVSQGNAGDLGKFQICAQEAVRRQLDAQSFAAGQVAATARPTTVAIRIAGTLSLVPVVVNGLPATLLLDTGATLTVLHPGFARRASIEVPADAPKMTGVVVGGQRYAVPFVKVRSLAVGDVTVEGIDVGVFEGLGHMPGIDGLLGANFLNHFKVTIDRSSRRLTLEPSRAAPPATAAAPVVAATADREWQLPVWTPGDEWRMSWKTPAGSGTSVLTVEGEETVDEIAYYVVRSGSRQTYYVKTTLGWHLEKVNGAVVLRRSPPIAHDWPLRVGKAWELRYRRQDGDGRATEFYRRCVAADETTLSVPAGTFLTLHVVCRDSNERVVSEAWYAEEVKSVVRERTVSSQGERVDELVSYTLKPAP